MKKTTKAQRARKLCEEKKEKAALLAISELTGSLGEALASLPEIDSEQFLRILQGVTMVLRDAAPESLPWIREISKMARKQERSVMAYIQLLAGLATTIEVTKEIDIFVHDRDPRPLVFGSYVAREWKPGQPGAHHFGEIRYIGGEIVVLFAPGSETVIKRILICSNGCTKGAASRAVGRLVTKLLEGKLKFPPSEAVQK